MTNIAAYIEQVAIHYWGEPTSRRGTELRWGNHGSKSVDLRKGVWHNHEDQTGGGVIDLVKANEPASINGNIPDVLEKKFGISKQQQKALPVVPSSHVLTIIITVTAFWPIRCCASITQRRSDKDARITAAAGSTASRTLKPCPII
jgi:hypothetical protein